MALRLSSPSIRHSNPSETSVAGSVTNSLTVALSAAASGDARRSTKRTAAHRVALRIGEAFLSICLSAGDLSCGSQLVLHDLSALHHELHPLQFGDVGEGIAGHGNQVGVLACVDRPDLILPAECLGVDHRPGLN